MLPLISLAGWIDRLNAMVGRGAAWCALLMVAAQFAVVVLRYVFGQGSVWLQESVLYAHVALILLAAGWTLSQGGHVRVDIFYGRMTPRRQAAVDLVGALFLLLPFIAAVAFYSFPYVARSWAILERSREVGGLPLVWLLKTLIPLFAVLLGLQGVAQAIRAWRVLQMPLSSPAKAGDPGKTSLDARLRGHDTGASGGK